MKGPDEARAVVGMKGTTDHTHTAQWANFRNKEPAVRNPAAGAPRPRPREHSLARLQSGHYPELGYQHEGHHRLSPYAKSLDRTDPGTEVRNEAPTERRDPLLGHRSTRVTSLPVRPMRGTSLPGTRNWGARKEDTGRRPRRRGHFLTRLLHPDELSWPLSKSRLPALGPPNSYPTPRRTGSR